MDNGPGWLPDPEDEAQERYWDGSAWTDRVRPAGRARSLRLPEHVPELQRALAAATADIDAVEDRLSTMFERTDGTGLPAPASTPAAAPMHKLDEDVFAEADSEAATSDTIEDETGTTPIYSEFPDLSDPDGADDEAFAELNAALASEEPEAAEEPEKPKPRAVPPALVTSRQSTAVTWRAS